MTTNELMFLIHKHLYESTHDPTMLIIEISEYRKFIEEQMRLVTYNSENNLEDKITIMGYTLRVIFATNLEEGEVIVL